MKRQKNQKNMKRGAKKGHLTNNGLLEDHGFRSTRRRIRWLASFVQILMSVFSVETRLNFKKKNKKLFNIAFPTTLVFNHVSENTGIVFLFLALLQIQNY